MTRSKSTLHRSCGIKNEIPKIYKDNRKGFHVTENLQFFFKPNKLQFYCNTHSIKLFESKVDEPLPCWNSEGNCMITKAKDSVMENDLQARLISGREENGRRKVNLISRRPPDVTATTKIFKATNENRKTNRSGITKDLCFSKRSREKCPRTRNCDNKVADFERDGDYFCSRMGYRKSELEKECFQSTSVSGICNTNVDLLTKTDNDSIQANGFETSDRSLVKQNTMQSCTGNLSYSSKKLQSHANFENSVSVESSLSIRPTKETDSAMSHVTDNYLAKCSAQNIYKSTNNRDSFPFMQKIILHNCRSLSFNSEQAIAISDHPKEQLKGNNLSWESQQNPRCRIGKSRNGVFDLNYEGKTISLEDFNATGNGKKQESGKITTNKQLLIKCNQYLIEEQRKKCVSSFPERSGVKRTAVDLPFTTHKAIKQKKKIQSALKRDDNASTKPLFQPFNAVVEKSNTFIKHEELSAKNNLQELDVEQVLGMRSVDDGVVDVLVLFKDGTSNWIQNVQLESQINSLLEYFSFSLHDIPVVHRLPFSVFGKKRDKDLVLTSKSPVQETRSNGVFNFGERMADNMQDEKINFQPTITKAFANIQVKKKMIDPLKEFVSSQKIIHHTAISTTPANNSDILMAPGRVKPFGYTEFPPFKQQSLPESFISVSKNKEFEELNGNKVKHIRIGELEIVESEFTQIILQHKDRRSKSIRTKTCDNLIQMLEMKSADNNCPFVVISGLEKYFSSTKDLEKILKLPAHMESSIYDERIASLRYLFQTLKNFPKPIIAFVSSAGTGLAASLLSLVDVVYDEQLSTSQINGIACRPAKLPVLIPKLMGLLPRNEALLMGEIPSSSLDDQLAQVEEVYKQFRFSNGLKKTLKEMKSNQKLSSNKLFLKKRGCQAKSKKKNTKHSGGVRSSVSKLCSPGLNIQEKLSTKIAESLEVQIQREKAIAVKSLRDLKGFWKELVETLI